jgi:hypothetical protein
VGHGEECGGFLEAEGAIRVGDGMTGRRSEEPGEALEQVGQLGLAVRLGLGLVVVHIRLSGDDLAEISANFMALAPGGVGIRSSRVPSGWRGTRGTRGVVFGPGARGAEQSALEEAVDVAMDGLADIPEEPGLRGCGRLPGRQPIELESGLEQPSSARVVLARAVEQVHLHDTIPRLPGPALGVNQVEGHPVFVTPEFPKMSEPDLHGLSLLGSVRPTGERERGFGLVPRGEPEFREFLPALGAGVVQHAIYLIDEGLGLGAVGTHTAVDWSLVGHPRSSSNPDKLQNRSLTEAEPQAELAGTFRGTPSVLRQAHCCLVAGGSGSSISKGK